MKHLLYNEDCLDLSPYVPWDWDEAHKVISMELATSSIKPEPVDFWYTIDEEYNKNMQRSETKVERRFKEYYDRTQVSSQNQIVLIQQKSFTTMHLHRGEATTAVREFPYVYDLVRSLPFETLGRAVIFENTLMHGTPKHIDLTYDQNPVAKGEAHFMLIDPVRSQPIFLTDREYSVQVASSHVRFFNTSCLHWTQPLPYRSYLIRVDGRFTDEFISKVRP